MKPITVMLVDDNKTFMRVMTEFLEAQGDIRVVYTTGDGREALARVQGLSPHVVLADLAMPGMHGLEFIPRLREAMPRIGIVALSVTDSPYFKNAALSAGANAFVSKAQVRTELVSVIRQLASGKTEVEKLPPPVREERPVRRVLVMEDDAHLRQIYSRALEGSGYAVYPAATLQEARHWLEQVRFDVLLCDIYMGQEHGTDLLQEYAETLTAGGAQTIIISGQARYRDLCEEMGADFFLEKPVTISTLVGLVNRITAQHSQALAGDLAVAGD